MIQHSFENLLENVAEDSMLTATKEAIEINYNKTDITVAFDAIKRSVSILRMAGHLLLLALTLARYWMFKCCQNFAVAALNTKEKRSENHS